MLRVVTLLFLTILLLQSCSTILIESPVIITLSPIHDVTVGLNQNNIVQSQLLDNDGNLYSIYWQLGAKKQSELDSTVQICNKQILSKQAFRKTRQLSEIDISELKPSLYKKYVECISNRGFTYVSGEANLPNKFRLTLYRGHSTRRDYMPVGIIYNISKKGASYVDVFRHTKECSADISRSKNRGVKEEYFDSFVSVSIEPYVASVKTCLVKYLYKFDKVVADISTNLTMQDCQSFRYSPFCDSSPKMIIPQAP